VLKSATAEIIEPRGNAGSMTRSLSCATDTEAGKRIVDAVCAVFLAVPLLQPRASAGTRLPQVQLKGAHSVRDNHDACHERDNVRTASGSALRMGTIGFAMFSVCDGRHGRCSTVIKLQHAGPGGRQGNPKKPARRVERPAQGRARKGCVTAVRREAMCARSQKGVFP